MPLNILCLLDSLFLPLFYSILPSLWTASNSHNASSKKMSLEEFLGNDSLGDSVWDEDEINLDAISNTTNIDLFRPKVTKDETTNVGPNAGAQRPYDRDRDRDRDRDNDGRRLGGQSPRIGSTGGVGGNNEFRRTYQDPAFSMGSIPYQRYNNRSQDPRLGGHVDMSRGGPPEATNFADFMPSPPYIIKFSNLPPKFSNFDIEDLFQAKYTKFVKFKLFWEINRNPSIDEVKNGTVFEQNFKRETKVAFVEVYTARDMSKILTYWRAPLKDIYKIDTEPAKFEDFKEYMTKVKLLTDPNDDAGRPYVPPKPKANPFGTAKPVDTQSKILDIEEKMDRLHIEDTTTLRRLSQGELFADGNKPAVAVETAEGVATTDTTQATPSAASTATTSPKLEHATIANENKPKISILKKPQLSYSEVLQRGVEESRKRSATTSPNLQAAVLAANTRESISTVLTGPIGPTDYSQSDLSNQGDTQANDGASADSLSIGESESSKGFTSDSGELPSADRDSEKFRGRSVSPSSRSKPFTFKNQDRETSPVGVSLSPVRRPLDSMGRQIYRNEAGNVGRDATSTQGQRDGVSQGQGQGLGLGLRRGSGSSYGRGGYSRGSTRGGYSGGRGGRGGSTGRYQNYNRQPRYSGGNAGTGAPRGSVSTSGGGFGRRGSYDNSGGYRQNRASTGQSFEHRDNSDDRNAGDNDSGQSYSLFKPASGFLKDEKESSDQRSGGNRYGGKGQAGYGYGSRGGRTYSGRGGGSNRGRGGYSGYR